MTMVGKRAVLGVVLLSGVFFFNSTVFAQEAGDPNEPVPPVSSQPAIQPVPAEAIPKDRFLVTQSRLSAVP